MHCVFIDLETPTYEIVQLNVINPDGDFFLKCQVLEIDYF